ncbi:MAG: FKBP-type peptidyl-prolyl cis-trans isomerase SlpA [Lentisphaeria bacterium]|jgi:FKBP-type peptidyl-prolyl cis-trans isomerase SlpA
MISENSQVTLFFELQLEDGQVIDSNFDRAPATFLVGDGQLLPGFENVLLGLEEGDKAQFKIAPEYGFGQPNPNNIQELPRKSFGANYELSPGLVVSFADAAGGERPGVVKSFDEDNVEIDFNHPLSGNTITFKVDILKVEPKKA